MIYLIQIFLVNCEIQWTIDSKPTKKTGKLLPVFLYYVFK